MENIHLCLTEKTNQNYALHQDYNKLLIQLEAKSDQIYQLKKELDILIETNSRLNVEKEEMEKTITQLREVKFKTKAEYEKINEENQRLSKICQEEEEFILSLEQEQRKYLDMIESLKYENNSLSTKLKQRDDNASYYQKQLEEGNKTISNMNNTIRELENEAEELKFQLHNISTQRERESNLLMEKERTCEDLTRRLREKEKDIGLYLNELDNVTEQKEKLYEENTHMYNEVDKLKNHLYILSEQNKKVIILSKDLVIGRT